MERFAIWLYYLDKDIFARLRQMIGSEWLESNAAIFSSLWAWTPLIAVAGMLLYLHRPKSAFFTLFFMLGAFVVSMQAALLLSGIFRQYPPWVVEAWLHGFQLPAYGSLDRYALPDSQMAAAIGIFWYARLHLKSWALRWTWLGWLPLVLLAILRIYAGHTYPLGVFTAFLVGILVAWLIYQLSRNVEFITRNGFSAEKEE